METDTEDYYRLLGVEPTADRAAIKKAYMRLVRKYHPDVAGEEGEAMTVRVNEAWMVLSNSDKRAEYDRSRAPKAATATTARPAPEDPWDDSAPADATDTSESVAPPEDDEEKISPRQTTLAMEAGAVAVAALVGVLSSFLSGARLGQSGGLILSALFAAFLVIVLREGTGRKFVYQGRWKAGLATAFLALTPLYLWRTEGGVPSPVWWGVAAGVLSLALVYAARWFVADYYSIDNPGITYFPLDAAMSFEQGEPSPEIPQFLMDTLRSFNVIHGVRIVHELWPYTAPDHIPAAIICGRKVVFLFTLPAGVAKGQWKRLLRMKMRSAGAARAKLLPWESAVSWVVTDIPVGERPKERGFVFVTPEEVPSKLSAYLGSGTVHRGTLFRVWKSKA